MLYKFLIFQNVSLGTWAPLRQEWTLPLPLKTSQMVVVHPATLRLRETGSTWFQSTLWECFGGQICRHVRNSSPQNSPTIHFETMAGSDIHQGRYYFSWRLSFVWGRSWMGNHERKKSPPSFSPHSKRSLFLEECQELIYPWSYCPIS